MATSTTSTTKPSQKQLRIIGLSDDEDHVEVPSPERPSKKRKLQTAEFDQLIRSVGKGGTAESALIQVFQNDPSMASRTFSIFGETSTLEPERAYPLFHLAQVASLESVMTVYSLFPKAITARTKCGGFTPHHLAAASRNDDVLLFLVLQYPTALEYSPSILGMLCERGAALELIQFCLFCYPQGLYQDHCSMTTPALSNAKAKSSNTRRTTLLHRACFTTTCAPKKLIDYLVKSQPQSCQVLDNDGNLPLHLLLETTNICAESVVVLLKAYPKSLHIPNQAGRLPLEIAMANDSSASSKLLLAMMSLSQQNASNGSSSTQSQAPPSLVPSSSLVVEAYLLESSPGQHLFQIRINDPDICRSMAQAISNILQNPCRYKQLTVALTRIEAVGMAWILQGLEKNESIEVCTLVANIGYSQQNEPIRRQNTPLEEEKKDVSLGRQFTPSKRPQSSVDPNHFTLLSVALQRMLLHNQTITSLDLSDNLLPSAQWLLPLAQHNKTLRILNLSGTKFGLTGDREQLHLLKVLTFVITNSSSLEEVHLVSCFNEDHALKLLHEALRATKNLRRVVLGKCSMELLTAAALTLQSNSNLHAIHFDYPACKQLQELHRKVEFWSEVNRVSSLGDKTKEDFVLKILAPQTANPSSSTSIIYELLHRAPLTLWTPRAA